MLIRVWKVVVVKAAPDEPFGDVEVLISGFETGEMRNQFFDVSANKLSISSAEIWSSHIYIQVKLENG